MLYNSYRKRRHSRYHYRGNNKKNREEKSFVKKLIQQVMVSAIIFLIVIALNSMENPFAKSITEQIKTILSYTVDLNQTYKSVSAFTENVDLLGKNQEKKKDDSGENIAAEDANEEKNVASEVKSAEIPQEISIPLNGVITSPFGMRKHPLTQEDSFHYGVDIDGKKGDPVVAAMDGEVVEAGYNDTYGNFVKIAHKDDFYTFYAHCDEIKVKVGQKVKMKEVIGTVGDTGTTIGVHLHFELWKKDQPLNPLDYFEFPSVS